jgi:erythronate-4-phosphate dehydrogenase
MKILADENIVYARKAFSAFGEVVLMPERSISREYLKDVAILLVRSITIVGKELLVGTSVRFVGTATIGIDHIDVEYLASHNIGFVHAPGSDTRSPRGKAGKSVRFPSEKLSKETGIFPSPGSLHRGTIF